MVSFYFLSNYFRATIQSSTGYAIDRSVEVKQSYHISCRLFFKAEPDLMPKYPFYKDEWNKIAYNDYSGSYPDQPSHTWFIVFREIFYVTEETLCVPKMYITVSTNMFELSEL